MSRRCALKYPFGVRPGFIVGPSVFVFGSSGCSSKVKGWRLFMIADARASFRPTRRPRSLMNARKGNPASTEQKPRGPTEKDRPIDPTSGKNSPASPSPIRRRARQADGRQPFMPQEYLTTPAFEDLSLSFRSCEANAAALVGRVKSAFHPARDQCSKIKITCKEISTNTVNRNKPPTLIVLAVRRSAPARPVRTRRCASDRGNARCRPPGRAPQPEAPRSCG